MQTEVATPESLTAFAKRYAGAWCSHDPTAVAAFYAEAGCLAINGGEPSVGRSAIAEAARSFMIAYPDLSVRFDRIEPKGGRMLFHWTFCGTNTGPDGTGAPVHISGYEDWVIGEGGLISESQGRYDAQEWARQVSAGKARAP